MVLLRPGFIMKMLICIRSLGTNIYTTESGKGGGVSLYVHNDISYSNRTDLNTMTDFVEAVFIEVDKSIFNTNKNVIFGTIYRPPNTNPTMFVEWLEAILHTCNHESKLCYL